MSKSKPLEYQNVTLFGIMIFADVITIKIARLDQVIPVTPVLIKGRRGQRHRHTQGRRPYDNRIKVWNYVDTSQGKPGPTRHWKDIEGFSPKDFGENMAL